MPMSFGSRGDLRMMGRLEPALCTKGKLLLTQKKQEARRLPASFGFLLQI